MNIPFNRPCLRGQELDAIASVLASGRLSGDGPVCASVEATLRTTFGASHVLLTTSCTHALEIAMLLLALKPGDEVIMPSFTFVSTANAVLSAGGRPVFCEIDERTLTLDPRDFERKITPRTRAVVPVHYAGISADLDEIMAIARANHLTVIEDAAQGLNATYNGKFLGTIGHMGAWSFHDSKNYVSGEGGAFVTNDEDLARRGEIVREKGTNRANFIRGEVDKYTWVDRGSSYILSDLLAAVLQSQLASLEYIQNQRRRVHEFYLNGLRDLEQAGKLRLPVIPRNCGPNYHIFYILLHTEQERISVMNRLREFGIGSTFHYVPLHTSPYALRELRTAGLRLPVTDRIFQTLLRLPIYPQLSEAELGYIVDCLHRVLQS